MPSRGNVWGNAWGAGVWNGGVSVLAVASFAVGAWSTGSWESSSWADRAPTQGPPSVISGSGGIVAQGAKVTAAASGTFVISDSTLLVGGGYKTAIASFSISGAGNLLVQGAKTDVASHDFRISGGGNATGSGYREFRVFSASGSGGITAKGYKWANTPTFQISGSGDLRGLGPQAIVMIGPLVPVLTRATFSIPATRAEIRTLAPSLILPDVT